MMILMAMALLLAGMDKVMEAMEIGSVGEKIAKKCCPLHWRDGDDGNKKKRDIAVGKAMVDSQISAAQYESDT